nr:PREDICTED: odorant-binding protein 2b-like [Equus przewalskii]
MVLSSSVSWVQDQLGHLDYGAVSRAKAAEKLKRSRMFPNVSNIFCSNEDTKYQFSLCLSADGGKRHVYILDLPVKDHHIFYCEGQLGGKAIRMAKLVGINPDMSLEALEEFKKFTERKGLPQDIIIMPVQTESCIPESD